MPGYAQAVRGSGWLGLLLLASVCGCSKSRDTTPPPPESAAEVLEKMLSAYHEADTYQDSGQVKLHFERAGAKASSADDNRAAKRSQAGHADKAVDQTWDYSIAFERPNRLRMHIYQVVAVSDGKKLRATLGFEQVRGQVLTVPMPEKLKTETLYGVDSVLAQAVTEGGVAGPPVILSFLLDDAALEPVLEGAGKPALLPPDKIEGQLCYRVEVGRTDGSLVFWIDQKSFVLRRLEYPTDDFRKSVEVAEGPVTDLSLVVDFQGAKLGGAIDKKAFQFETPDDARVVEQFLLPPALLGQRIGDFRFVSDEGEPITRESLAGKVVVLDFWATWCEPCLKSLPNLQQAADRYKDHDQVRFLAVSVDASDVTDAAVREKFSELGLSVPLARDPDQAARAAFIVEGLPTTVILGPDGVVQDFEAAYNPDLAEQLAVKVDRVLAGQNIYEETLKEYLPASPETAAAAKQVQPAAIAPRSEPSKLKLEALWTREGLTAPGNLLAITDGADTGKILALDGWRTVVELDAATGEIVARHELDLPKGPTEAVVSFLRTGTDADGRRWYAGSANGVERLFLFDADWQRVLAFPKEGTNAGITDCLLSDIDGDGQLELVVGFWGPTGVQCLTLQGKQRWQSQSLENVLRLAATDANGQRQLLTSSALGSIATLDAQGKAQPPVTVGKRFVQLVHAADLDGDGQAELIGLGPSQAAEAARVGDNIVFGIGPGGEELWHYDLPAGLPANGALELVASGNLLGSAGQWVLAGPDGSVHILAADGTLVDRFNTGVAISGLTVAAAGDEGMLVVAGERGIEAWRLAK